jgi:hypothetical protein
MKPTKRKEEGKPVADFLLGLFFAPEDERVRYSETSANLY